jgi:hypothetical protein
MPEPDRSIYDGLGETIQEDMLLVLKTVIFQEAVFE